MAVTTFQSVFKLQNNIPRKKMEFKIPSPPSLHGVITATLLDADGNPCFPSAPSAGAEYAGVVPFLVVGTSADGLNYKIVGDRALTTPLEADGDSISIPFVFKDQFVTTVSASVTAGLYGVDRIVIRIHYEH